MNFSRHIVALVEAADQRDDDARGVISLPGRPVLTAMTQKRMNATLPLRWQHQECFIFGMWEQQPTE